MIHVHIEHGVTGGTHQFAFQAEQAVMPVLTALGAHVFHCHLSLLSVI